MNGVGTGMSPSDFKRHNSLPVLKSYPAIYGNPFVTIWVRSPDVKTPGVAQLHTDTPERGTRQSSRPSAALNAARKLSFLLSDWMITFPSNSAGELAKPQESVRSSDGAMSSVP